VTTVGEFLGIESEPWMADALCAQADPDRWFPNKGEKTADVKRICAKCDVRLECLRYALDRNEPHGIYGGMSENERRLLRKRQSAARRRAA